MQYRAPITHEQASVARWQRARDCVAIAAGLQPQRLGPGVARAMIDAHGLPIISKPLLRLAACWWANWTSGVALVVPALRLLNRANWPALDHRLRELVVIALSLVAWGIADFAPLPWVACLPLSIFALVLVTWSAIRFGGSLAALIPLALALTSSAAFIADRNRLRSAYLDASDLAARRLGHELHDGLGQELVALSLMISAERTRVERGEAPSIETLDQIDDVAKRAVIACRTIAHGLSALAETGGHLPGALQRLVERFGGDGAPAISVAIENEAALVLSQAARDHVYRIAQEALANVVKHARAKHVDVRLIVTPARVVLTVRDDGVGLSLDSAHGSGLGLASMRHRATAIGARLTVTTLPGGGTEVRLDCPQGSPASAQRLWIGGRDGSARRR